MRVLSLFDGMACGMLAFGVAGIQVDRYVAFEIDKYAVQTSSHNFPMIEHRGDVFEADFTEFSGFDFLVGGSPCTYWSIAQKNNRETVASGMGWELFCQYVRALNEAKPRFFVYENNKSMSNAIRESITKTFGFEPICINSALVSAQNRQRLYWVGKRNDDGTYSRVKVEQPEDRGVLLRDVLDSGTAWQDKSFCITATEYKGSNPQQTLTKHRRTMVAEPVAINTTADGDKARTLMAGYYKYGTATLITNKGFTGGTTAVAEPLASTVLNINPSGKGMNGAVGRIDAKSRCLTTNKGEGQKILVPVGIGYRGRIEDGKWVKRFESNGESKANALTTAQTDSMVSEPVGVSEPCIYQVPHGFNDGGIKYEKAPTLTANGCWVENNKIIDCFAVACEWDEEGKPTKAISGADGQTYTVYRVQDGKITIKDKQYPIKLADGYYIIRKLTVSECKRLQTVPEWYEFPVSNTQAYKMLGNGWTVEVIAHLINATQADVLADGQLNLFEIGVK